MKSQLTHSLTEKYNTRNNTAKKRDVIILFLVKNINIKVNFLPITGFQQDYPLVEMMIPIKGIYSQNL